MWLFMVHTAINFQFGVGRAKDANEKYNGKTMI